MVLDKEFLDVFECVAEKCWSSLNYIFVKPLNGDTKALITLLGLSVLLSVVFFQIQMSPFQIFVN